MAATIERVYDGPLNGEVLVRHIHLSDVTADDTIDLSSYVQDGALTGVLSCWNVSDGAACASPTYNVVDGTLTLDPSGSASGDVVYLVISYLATGMAS